MTERHRDFAKRTPQHKSLVVCAERGWIADAADKWLRHQNITRDLFSVFDIVAIAPLGIVAIQTTSHNGGNMAARRRKVVESEAAQAWAVHAKILLHGWKGDELKEERLLGDLYQRNVSFDMEVG